MSKNGKKWNFGFTRKKIPALKFWKNYPINLVKTDFQSRVRRESYAYRCICTGTAIVRK